MRYEIRELEVGGMLDLVIKLCRDHMGFLAVIVCVVLLPIHLPVSLWEVWMLPQLDLTTIADMDREDLTAYQAKSFPMTTLTLWVLGFSSALAQGAVAYGTAHRYLGKDISAGACIREALRKWLRLLGATIVYGLGVGLGTVCLVVPGILLALAWYVLYPVLLFEDLPAGKAFGRSNTLMNGQKGRAFVLGFLLLVVSCTSILVIEWVPNEYVAAAIGSIQQCFIVALNGVAATVVYFSARCRNEQFDLEMLVMIVEGKQHADQPAL